MRKDIFEFVERMKKEAIRPNYSEIARRYDCDYPESYCIKCNKLTVVPLDVYNRIKKF